MTGEEFTETGSSEAAPTAFPTEDIPIDFENGTFCLTGKFIFGPRSSVEQLIESKGGVISKGVTQMTDYLVIGTLSSPDWVHSSHGLKIQKAVSLKESGHPIAIIAERDLIELA